MTIKTKASQLQQQLSTHNLAYHPTNHDSYNPINLAFYISYLVLLVLTNQHGLHLLPICLQFYLTTFLASHSSRSRHFILYIIPQSSLCDPIALNPPVLIHIIVHKHIVPACYKRGGAWRYFKWYTQQQTNRIRILGENVIVLIEQSSDWEGLFCGANKNIFIFIFISTFHIHIYILVKKSFIIIFWKSLIFFSKSMAC